MIAILFFLRLDTFATAPCILLLLVARVSSHCNAPVLCPEKGRSDCPRLRARYVAPITGLSKPSIITSGNGGTNRAGGQSPGLIEQSKLMPNRNAVRLLIRTCPDTTPSGPAQYVSIGSDKRAIRGQRVAFSKTTRQGRGRLSCGHVEPANRRPRHASCKRS